MSHAVPGKVSVAEFARQIRGQLVPLSRRFSYFFTALSLGEEDVKEYLEEPLTALPPALTSVLPDTAVLLVPFLERVVAPSSGGSDPSEDLISFDQPDEKRQVWDAGISTSEGAVIAFGLRGQDVADYHFRLYRRLAVLASQQFGEDFREQFFRIVTDELVAGIHGEVDEESWELKQALLRRQKKHRRRTKGFTRYAEQALVDTLTLYLHGICCDIDVDTGPRQLASRHLRRRLELLQSIFPPPDGYAVFPEDLKLIESNGSPSKTDG